jgi:hypothetical protein
VPQEDPGELLFPSRSDDKVKVVTHIPITHEPNLLSVDEKRCYTDEIVSLPD